MKNLNTRNLSNFRMRVHAARGMRASSISWWISIIVLLLHSAVPIDGLPQVLEHEVAEWATGVLFTLPLPEQGSTLLPVNYKISKFYVPEWPTHLQAKLTEAILVESSTGRVRFEPMQMELLRYSLNAHYWFEVVDFSGQMNALNVSLRIRDENNEPPTFVSMPTKLLSTVNPSFAFHGTLLTRIHAEDSDAGSRVMYAMGTGVEWSEMGRRISVNPREGTVRLRGNSLVGLMGASSFENRGVLPLQAWDANARKDLDWPVQRISKMLTVSNQARPPQFLIEPFYSLQFQENIAIGTMYVYVYVVLCLFLHTQAYPLSEPLGPPSSSSPAWLRALCLAEKFVSVAQGIQIGV